MSYNTKPSPVNSGSSPNGSTDPYPQPSHSHSPSSYSGRELSLSSPVEPVNHPWWAESDYIPPYIQQFVEANAGLSLVCAAQLFFALMNVTVKYFISSTDISIPSLILVRQGITVIGCLCTLHYLNEPNPFLGPPELRGLLLARGLFGTGALVSTYESFQGLTVSDTTAIQFLTPSVLVVLGYVILREKTTRRELIAGFLCLIGVLLVSRPPFIFGDLEQEVEVPPGRVNLPPGPNGEGEGDHKVISRAAGVAWAFASVLGSSFAYLIIRAVGKRAHALHTMVYFAYTCCIGTLPLVLFVPGQGRMPTTLKGFFFIILIGIFGFMGQTLLTLGLQREKAGRASLAIYTSVFFAIILELVIFHTFPSLLSLVGVSIILTSALYVAIHGTKAIETARRGDEESNPISRSASPLPSPDLGPGTGTTRGGHYSYTNIPTTDTDNDNEARTDIRNDGRGSDNFSKPGDGAKRKDQRGGKGELEVPRSKDGGPTLGRRRSSGLSDVARTR